MKLGWDEDRTVYTYSLDVRVNKIYHQLEELGEDVNCHSGTFDTEDILKNANYIRELLDEYIKIEG